MALRYHYLDMMRTRVGGEGVAPEELQALSGRLESARHELSGAKASGKLGFFEVPKRKPSLLEMQRLLSKLDKEVDTLVVIGIGGSLLGAQALHKALDGLATLKRGARKLRVLFAGDSTDPQAVKDLLDKLDWRKTALNVISKSGDTIEPMATFVLLRSLLARAVGLARAAKRIVATTDPERGTLRTIADREGYATLPVPGDVGGRFSVFTEVGAFPLLAASIDVESLWRGAAAEDREFWKKSPLQNLPMLYAGLQYLLLRKGKHVSVLMPYAERLSLVGTWYRQLWAESLGKKNDRHRNRVHVGPTPVAALGPSDQHSQIQLYNEGPFDKIVTLVEVEEFASDFRLPDPFPDIEGVSYFAGFKLSEIVHAERQGTSEALTANRRPNGTIVLPDLSGESLGRLLQMLMTATAVMGELMDVNAFDQPGVEAGKQAMYEILGRKE
jgi:glucose-6-phosphate isomerase